MARSWRVVGCGWRVAARGFGVAGAGLGVVVATLAVGACGDAPQTDSALERSASDASDAAGEIRATHPWVRVAIVPVADADGAEAEAEHARGEDPAGEDATGQDAAPAAPVNTAAYVVLTNPTDAADALMAVETTVADTAEIHTVSMDDGIMRMRAVDSVPLPAGAAAALEPGGYHVMLIGLRRPLAEGDSVPLRFRLRSGTTLDVTAPVLRSPPL